MNEYEKRQIELLEEIAKDIKSVNVKTDKVITLLKHIADKTEGMI